MDSILQQISVAAQSGIPTLWIGQSGIGKTKMVKSIAKALGIYFYACDGNTHDPTDFGFPKEIDGYIHSVPMFWARHMIDAADGDMSANGKLTSILFMDEITTCKVEMQKAMLKVVAELIVGDEPLPESVGIIGAGNPWQSATDGRPLTPAMANRWCHRKWIDNLTEYQLGEMAGWPVPDVRPLPKGWRAGIPAERTLNVTFLSVFPHYAQAQPVEPDGVTPDLVKGAGPWPSHRTWSYSAVIRAAAKAGGLSAETGLEFMEGLVGPEATMTFVEWQAKMDLPNPEDLLANPDALELDSRRDDKTYATLLGIVGALSNKIDDERWNAAWRIIELAVKKYGKTDIAMIAASGLNRLAVSNYSIPVQALITLEPMLKATGLVRG